MHFDFVSKAWRLSYLKREHRFRLEHFILPGIKCIPEVQQVEVRRGPLMAVPDPQGLEKGMIKTVVNAYYSHLKPKELGAHMPIAFVECGAKRKRDPTFGREAVPHYFDSASPIPESVCADQTSIIFEVLGPEFISRCEGGGPVFQILKHALWSAQSESIECILNVTKSTYLCEYAMATLTMDILDIKMLKSLSVFFFKCDTQTLLLNVCIGPLPSISLISLEWLISLSVLPPPQLMFHMYMYPNEVPSLSMAREMVTFLIEEFNVKVTNPSMYVFQDCQRSTSLGTRQNAVDKVRKALKSKRGWGADVSTSERKMSFSNLLQV